MGRSCVKELKGRGRRKKSWVGRSVQLDFWTFGLCGWRLWVPCRTLSDPLRIHFQPEKGRSSQNAACLAGLAASLGRGVSCVCRHMWIQTTCSLDAVMTGSTGLAGGLSDRARMLASGRLPAAKHEPTKASVIKASVDTGCAIKWRLRYPLNKARPCRAVDIRLSTGIAGAQEGCQLHCSTVVSANYTGRRRASNTIQPRQEIKGESNARKTLQRSHRASRIYEQTNVSTF